MFDTHVKMRNIASVQYIRDIVFTTTVPMLCATFVFATHLMGWTLRNK